MNEKLMIAIPSLDYIHWRFAECLSKLTARLGKIGVEHEVRFKGGSLVYIAREELAKDAMAGKFTHVLWLDADMIFPETIYEQLLSRDKEIISCVYRGRHNDNKVNLFASLCPPERVNLIEGMKECFQIKGCGFGCTLTTTRTLQSVLLEYCTLFTPTPQFGEDLAFCFRAGEMDISLWADNKAECGHIGQAIVWPDRHTEWI